jgi:hypothetical protein
VNSQLLQREAKKLVNYIISLGNSFRIITAQQETHIGAIITDAVLQVGHHWKRQVGPRVERIKSEYPEAATISGILRLLQTIGAQDLLNWKGTDEQKRFHQTVEFFDREGIDSSDDLRSWLASDNNRERLITKSSRHDKAGIDKIADKTVDYYRTMVDIPDAVAIDALIRDFLKDAGVKPGNYHKARTIVQLAAPMLAAAKSMTIRPVDLDRSIWEFQSENKKRKGAGHTNSGAVAAPEERKKEEEYEMNKSHQVLEVTLRPDTMKQLEKIAEDEFGVEASILAQIWIVERLKQLCVGYPRPPSKFQYATRTQAPSSGSTVCLEGILDNSNLRNRPLGVRINNTESKKLPWNQHLVDITLIINNNPYPAILHIFTGFGEFKTKGSYIKQDNQFNKDLDILGLNRLDRVKLEADGARDMITIKALKTNQHQLK